MPDTTRLLMTPADMAEAIQRVASDLLASATNPHEETVLIGIHNRGVPFARRLAAALQASHGLTLPVGTLDITQHRDDLGTIQNLPVLIGSDIPFAIDEARVILCDEVIHTGRSIRAALSELLDFGRPARVQLAVLVDRGGREFPIQPDYAGLTIALTPTERVSVHFTEGDHEDAVRIEPARTA